MLLTAALATAAPAPIPITTSDAVARLVLVLLSTVVLVRRPVPRPEVIALLDPSFRNAHARQVAAECTSGGPRARDSGHSRTLRRWERRVVPRAQVRSVVLACGGVDLSVLLAGSGVNQPVSLSLASPHRRPRRGAVRRIPGPGTVRSHIQPEDCRGSTRQSPLPSSGSTGPSRRSCGRVLGAAVVAIQKSWSPGMVRSHIQPAVTFGVQPPMTVAVPPRGVRRRVPYLRPPALTHRCEV